MLSEFDAWDAMCFDAFDDPKRGFVVLLIPYADTLKFYSDASTNPPNASRPGVPLLYSVGGYIASVRDWRSFRKEWRKVLAEHGFGDRPFHMTDFERDQNAILTNKPLSSKSPYQGWKHEEFLPFQQEIHKVLTRVKRNGHFRLEGFMAAVVRSDFTQFIPEAFKNELGFGSEYMWNVILNMESIAMWADENGYHDPIHYVFASGDRQEGDLGRWFEACWNIDFMCRHYRLSKSYSVMPYSIAEMKFEPAIQAADVGVYEFNKAAIQAVENGGDLDVGRLRKSLLNIAKVRHNGKVMTLPELELARDHMLKQRGTYPEWPHVGPMVEIRKGATKRSPE